MAILKMLDYASITDKLPITEKNEQYLRKIIDLCKQKNITLILMAAPFEATEEAAMRLNTVAEIAKEEGVPFLNYVKEWDSLGMDANTDFYDGGHFNNQGIVKFSRIVGQYLSQNYSLRDCRKIEGFIWNASQTTADKNKAEFTLSNQFSGDGVSEYYDTKIKLYENRYSSWTILTQIVCPCQTRMKGRSLWLALMSKMARIIVDC